MTDVLLPSIMTSCELSPEVINLALYPFDEVLTSVWYLIQLTNFYYLSIWVSDAGNRYQKPYVLLL